MQVVGDTYQNIFAALSLVEKANIQSGGYTSSQLQQVLSRIRSEYTNQRKTVQVSSYSHIPQIGLYSEVGSDGVSTNYRYDLIGRLRRILDHNLNVVKQYRYHYANHADDGDIDMGEPERMPYQEPIWELTGVEKCERNNNRLTGFITQEYKNINPAYTPADETIWLRDSARFGPRYCPSDYWWEQKGEVVHIHRSYIENKDDLNVRLNFKIKVTTPTGSEVGIYDYDVYFHNNLNEQKVIQDYYEYPGYNISIIEWCWIDGNGVRFLCSPPAPEPEPEPDRTPFWIATGEYECLKDSNDRNTGYASYRERDENPHSPTYNEYRIQARQSLGNCPVDSGLAKYSYTLVNPDRDPIIHLRRTFDDGRTAIFHIEVAVELGDGSIEKDQVEYRFYNSSETSSIHVVQIFHQLNAKRAWLTMNCWIEYR